MKTTANILGYFAALFTFAAVIFKLYYLAGAGIMLIVSQMLLAVYLPVYIINRLADVNKGKILAHHIALAISIGFIPLWILFKIQRWPASAELLLAGSGTFSLVYLPMLVIYKIKQQLPQNFKIIYAAGFIGAFLLSAGIPFKILHWPASSFLIMAGAGILFVIYFPMYIFNFSANVEDTYLYLRDIFFAIIIGSVLALFLVREVTHEVVEKEAQRQMQNEQIVPHSE